MTDRRNPGNIFQGNSWRGRCGDAAQHERLETTIEMYAFRYVDALLGELKEDIEVCGRDDMGRSLSSFLLSLPSDLREHLLTQTGLASGIDVMETETGIRKVIVYRNGLSITPQ